jgi:uncharacterized SAM-binding protein YcdF (DUF218 family)
MFLLKKLVSLMLLPFSLSVELLILGLILLLCSRRMKTAKTLLTLGTIMLMVFSYSRVSNGVLRPLESKYPVLTPKTIPTVVPRETLDSVRWIVVLGGGHYEAPDFPPISQLTRPSLSRLLMGVELSKALPGRKLILSGGRVYGPVSDAEIMSQVAVSLGIPANDIVLEPWSKDTDDEARLIREIVHDDRIILVTSAFHMTRSMALFTKAGMRPIPAPADLIANPSVAFNPGAFFPSGEALEQTAVAAHEYMGLLWAWIRGKI